MPMSTTVSTGQYHSAVICAQRTRRAAPREKGRSVRRISPVGLHSDASALATFQMTTNCAAAKQVPRCLRPVQPMQAVNCTLFRSLSLAVLLSGAVAHPVRHCWCDSSRLVVIVHVLQVSSAFCITFTSRYSLAPYFLRQSTSCATPTISPLRFRALFSFVLQSALTLPLHQGPHTTTTRSALRLAAPGISLICTPMP